MPNRFYANNKLVRLGQQHFLIINYCTDWIQILKQFIYLFIVLVVLFVLNGQTDYINLVIDYYQSLHNGTLE